MNKCDVCGKTEGRIHNSKKYGAILCSKHYSQMDQYGKILERTKFDANEVIVSGNIAEIITYDASHNESGRVLIDTKYLNIVKKYKWYLDSDGYAENRTNGKTTTLHRLITNAPKGTVVDHINHNILDNRKDNLRVCTNQENILNHKIGTNNTSGYSGVSLRKTTGKWHAQIKFNGINNHIGYYTDIQDAIAARKAAEAKYFGEFAYKEVADY